MSGERKGQYKSAGDWLTGGVHLTIVLIAVDLDSKVEELSSPTIWAWAFVAMGLIGFCAWMANYKRWQQIAGTPTSKVVSAAQGYAELEGEAIAHDESVLLTSPITHTHCLWYSFVSKERRGSGKNSHWVTIDSGHSEYPVVLDDGSGKAAVHVHHAEIVTTHKHNVREGNVHHTEWLLLPGDGLYVIGEFATVGGANSVFDVKADVGQLLTEWKDVPEEMHKRFDLNNDGQIDMTEWMLARRQARREVEKRHAEIRNQPGTHILRKPKDGRYFLVSNLPQKKLGRRYWIWGWAHAIMTVGSAAASFYFFTHPHL